MTARPLLVIGTSNRKKAAELVQLLAPVGLEVRTLADYPQAAIVEETGDSFAANSRLKAVEQARRLGHWVLGEDSGLAVDALSGAPGIFSARFAGSAASDEENNRHLLQQLKGTPLEKRTAHYVCHIAVADPQGTVRAESKGFCRGRIRLEPAGAGGFGYDPLFEIVEYHRTFGELGPAVKAVLSHRARAASLIASQLIELVDTGHWV